jgi:hypothetical protein
MISGTEEMSIFIVVSITITLNQGTSSGRQKISYTKCELFTKLKFIKHEEIIFSLHGTSAGPRVNSH